MKYLHTSFKNLHWLIWLMPVLLLTFSWTSYPFSEELLKNKVSLSELSNAQRSNIQLAARAINGIVLKPGETFSFNKVVGPRTVARGYRAARSYLGTESPDTVGGGICLVSSALYQLALQSGCRIDKRVAHTHPIRTISPGLDATVWYGQADLTFTNTLSIPLQIAAESDANMSCFKLMGKKDGQTMAHVQICRRVVRSTSRELLVEVVRKTDTEEKLLSRDLYLL